MPRAICHMFETKPSIKCPPFAITFFAVFLWMTAYLSLCPFNFIVSFLVRLTSMVVKEFFHLPVFLILLVLFYSVNTQYHRDSRENSFSGGAIGDVCLRESYRDVRCQSFNYVFIQEKCELSNRIKEAGPENFVLNSERYYFRRDT